MNFKGKGTNMDFIVSFSPSADDFAGVRDGVYTRGRNQTVDKFVFDREKGAKLCIQASHFSHNRKTPCPKPVNKCDPNPYLRNNIIRSMDGGKHLVHYNETPDTPTFVRNIFNTASEIAVAKTKHGGYNVFCAVTGDIRKFSNGEYCLDPNSIKPVPWKISSWALAQQLTMTKNAKNYQKSLAAKVVEED